MSPCDPRHAVIGEIEPAHCGLQKGGLVAHGGHYWWFRSPLWARENIIEFEIENFDLANEFSILDLLPVLSRL